MLVVFEHFSPLLSEPNWQRYLIFLISLMKMVLAGSNSDPSRLQKGQMVSFFAQPGHIRYDWQKLHWRAKAPCLFSIP